MKKLVMIFVGLMMLIATIGAANATHVADTGSTFTGGLSLTTGDMDIQSGWVTVPSLTIDRGQSVNVHFFVDLPADLFPQVYYGTWFMQVI